MAEVDVKSPTTLVMEYLASKGFSPNMKGYGGNVRRALEANERDPTLIPGLRGAPDPLVGQSGNAATRVEGAPLNLVQEGGSFDTGGRTAQGATPPVDRRGNPTTSAAPPAASQTPSPTVATQPPVPPPTPITQASPVTSFDTETPPMVNTGVPGAGDTSNAPMGLLGQLGKLGPSILLGLPAAGGAVWAADRALQNAGGRMVNPPLPATGVGGTPLGPDPNLAPPPPETFFPAGSASAQSNPPPMAPEGGVKYYPTSQGVSPSVAPAPVIPTAAMDKAMAPAGPQVVGDLNPVARPGSLDMTPPRGPTSATASEPVLPQRGAPRIPPTPAELAMAQRLNASRASRLFRRPP